MASYHREKGASSLTDKLNAQRQFRMNPRVGKAERRRTDTSNGKSSQRSVRLKDLNTLVVPPTVVTSFGSAVRPVEPIACEIGRQLGQLGQRNPTLSQTLLFATLLFAIATCPEIRH